MAESSVACTKRSGTVAEKKAESKSLHHKGQLLQKRDSGYNSPVTPGTTPENVTTPSKAKSLHLGVQPLRSISSPATVTEGAEDMQRVVRSQLGQLPSGKNGVLKRQLSSPGALDSSQSGVSACSSCRRL